MSLAVALNTARSSLLATAKQVSVSGSNIAGADDPNYQRKIALPSTAGDGSVKIVTVSRATDLPVFYRLLSSKATTNGQNAMLAGLERLHDAIGDTADGNSPAARIAALATALQDHANAPNDRSLAQAAITAAQSAVTGLGNASQTVLTVRNDADTAMAASVNRINDLLAEFTTVNGSLVRATIAGDDVTGMLDQRDALLAKLSDEVGIAVIVRANNDVAIYTDGGVPLFEKLARSVAFQTTTALGPGIVGSPVLIDGVPVTGDNATMPLRAGTLAGLATLRDVAAPTFQAQLDEIARGLVEAFAESDQSGGGGPALTGLFTYPGGPGLPATGTLASGLAATIRVNPGVNPAQGGSLERIRDGGINGVNYDYNITGAASFADRLDEMTAALGAPRSFDSASALESGVSMTTFATASVSWLEDQRKTVSADAAYHDTLTARASEALSNATGVNIDQEYAIQLQLEHSYAASSKLISIINQLFEILIAAV